MQMSTSASAKNASVTTLLPCVVVDIALDPKSEFPTALFMEDGLTGQPGPHVQRHAVLLLKPDSDLVQIRLQHMEEECVWVRIDPKHFAPITHHVLLNPSMEVGDIGHPGLSVQQAVEEDFALKKENVITLHLIMEDKTVEAVMCNMRDVVKTRAVKKKALT